MKRIVILITVFTLSLLIAIIQSDPFYKGISTIPAILSLFGFLWQYVRDEVAYENNRRLQNEQNQFNLAATSHMANIVFEKQVAFCEEYVVTLDQALSCLLEAGPSKAIEGFLDRLIASKKKYITWLSSELVENLEIIENEMQRIITNDYLINHRRQTEPERSVYISEMWKSFNRLIGVNNKDDEFNPRQTVNGIIEYVKGILGIAELEMLRREMVSRSISTLKKP
jgi:hypothetical protein